MMSKIKQIKKTIETIYYFFFYFIFFPDRLFVYFKDKLSINLNIRDIKQMKKILLPMMTMLYLIHIPCVFAEKDEELFEKTHPAEAYHNKPIRQQEKIGHPYVPKYGTIIGINGSPIAIGGASRVNNDSPAIAIGDSAIASGNNSISIGGSSYSEGTGNIAIGSLSRTDSNDALAVGGTSYARAQNSTALGSSASTGVNAVWGTAIGSKSFSGSATSVALGHGSISERKPATITERFTHSTQNTFGEVSVGNNNQLRQITHVAGGTQTTDAVNVGQLQMAYDGINNLKSIVYENSFKNKELIENIEANKKIISDRAKDIKQHEQEANQFATLIQEHKEHAFSSLQKTQGHEINASISAKNAAKDESSSHSSAVKTAKFKDMAEHDAQSIKRNKITSEEVLAHIKKSRDDARTMAETTEMHEIAASKSSHKAAEHEENTRLSANEAVQYRDTIFQAQNTAADSATQTTQYRDNARSAFMEIEGYKQDAYSNLIALDKQYKESKELLTQETKDTKSIDSKITQNKNSIIHLGRHVNGTSISVTGQQGDRMITGVADGVRSNDAANIAQLNRVKHTATTAHDMAQKNTSRINNLENKLSQTNAKIDRGLAASAALTGLFQPYGVGKFNVTTAVGGYGSSQALAIGTGYRINENIAIKAGAAYSSGSSMMYNASFNIEW